MTKDDVSSYRGTAPYIFISYAHTDTDRVMPLITRLQTSGYRIWFDEGIEAGREWAVNIVEYLNSSTCVIAFLTQNYLNSENCMDEIEHAKNKKIPTLIIYMDDVNMPDWFVMRHGRTQAIFCSHYETEEKLFGRIYEATILRKCMKDSCNSEHTKEDKKWKNIDNPEHPISPEGNMDIRNICNENKKISKKISKSNSALDFCKMFTSWGWLVWVLLILLFGLMLWSYAGIAFFQRVCRLSNTFLLFITMFGSSVFLFAVLWCVSRTGIEIKHGYILKCFLGLAIVIIAFACMKVIPNSWQRVNTYRLFFPEGYSDYELEQFAYELPSGDSLAVRFPSSEQRKQEVCNDLNTYASSIFDELAADNWIMIVDPVRLAEYSYANSKQKNTVFYSYISAERKELVVCSSKYFPDALALYYSSMHSDDIQKLFDSNAEKVLECGRVKEAFKGSAELYFSYAYRYILEKRANLSVENAEKLQEFALATNDTYSYIIGLCYGYGEEQYQAVDYYSYEDVYESVLEEYRKEVLFGKQHGNTLGNFNTDPFWLASYYAMSHDPSQFMYSLEDLNKNGIPELICLFEDGTLFTIFYLNNINIINPSLKPSPQYVTHFSEHVHGYIYEDGSIRVFSGTAGYECNEIIVINKDQTSILCDKYEKEYPPYTDTYEYQINGKSVSEAEFNSVCHFPDIEKELKMIPLFH